MKNTTGQEGFLLITCAGPLSGSCDLHISYNIMLDKISTDHDRRTYFSSVYLRHWVYVSDKYGARSKHVDV